MQPSALLTEIIHSTSCPLNSVKSIVAVVYVYWIPTSQQSDTVGSFGIERAVELHDNVLVLRMGQVWSCPLAKEMVSGQETEREGKS